MKLTTSQAAAYGKILAMARCHFAPPSVCSKLELKPRLTPLLVGPTGVGKTALSLALASDLKAPLVRAPISAWIPRGARAVPTLDTIEAKREEGRVIILVDELDKFHFEFHEWSAACAAEVFQLLDEAQIDRKTFVIGAGTWQQMHEPRKSLGFVSQAGEVFSQDKLIDNAAIPKELLLRFATPVIHLQYPEVAETAGIMEQLGVLEAATKVGLKIDPATHRWIGGMRSLECLATEIALLAFAQEAEEIKRRTERTAEVLRSKIKRSNRTIVSSDWLSTAVASEQTLFGTHEENPV